MQKFNVESFNLDHTKVAAPYIRLVTVIEGEHGDKIYKYDVRLKQPNQSRVEMPALHALEHLLAENIRNHLDNVIDLSPMGCQTGVYLLVLNNDSLEQIKVALIQTFQDVLNAEEVPADNEIQCGWAANHDLAGAKAVAQEMLAHQDEWDKVFK